MNATMPAPSKPRHVNDRLGRAVIEPPTQEAVSRVEHWRHVNRQRITLNKVLSILEDPKTYAR